jgi:Flp pilus assembly protein TadG
MRRTGADRGAATAELVMVLPVLVAVMVALVWLLVVGAGQLRVIDAARESARAAARGDSADAAVAAGVRVGPQGTHVTIVSSGGEVVAQASAQLSGPGGLLGFLPGARLHASAVALTEATGEPAGEAG